MSRPRLPAVFLALALAVPGLAAAGCGGDAPAYGGGTSAGAHMLAVGASGLMLSAFDGVSVAERPAVTAASLRALVAIDDQLAWAVGDGGTILATRDRGATWAPQAAPVTSTLWGAAFADAGRGYAVGDAGVVLRTGDAGVTWTRLPLANPAAGLRGVAAAQSGGLVLAVGEGGAVLRSTDGGASFARVVTPVSGTLNAVRLAEDELRAVAVGDGGAVIASDDGGASWRAEGIAPADLRGVALDDRGAVAVGAGGLIWRRVGDAGAWAAVPSGTTADLAAVKFAREAPALGWVVGASGTVLYSSDGGAHFRPLTSLLRAPLTAVEDL
jgi:photosystem II stability/assembly factor-like uncharacterized protein